MDAYKIIDLLLNFKFNVLGFDFKFLYLVVIAILLRIFFMFFNNKG